MIFKGGGLRFSVLSLICNAPSNRIYVVERPMNDWMTDDSLVLKALPRKYESLWRKTRLTVHFDMYSGSCMDVKTAISKSKSEILLKKISDCNGDQKKTEIFTIISGMNKNTCSSDPFPTRLLMSHLHAIVPILQHILQHIKHVYFLLFECG